jgi:rare lipoprotein A
MIDSQPTRRQRSLRQRLGWAPSVAAALVLAACRTVGPPREHAAPTPVPAPKGTAVTPPPAAFGTPPLVPQNVPDAVPRIEPRSRYGNPPFYDVFGKRYHVLSASSGYVERGVASWYGPGFHAERTSTGEPYDMYGMTAAHKTLPLPAYARVTNLQNGRSCVVRINDRGPFVSNRIIDLSWTAAAKLDMLRNGTAIVEVRVLDPAVPQPLLVQTPAGAPVTLASASGARAAARAAAPAPAAAVAPVVASVVAPVTAPPPTPRPATTAAASATTAAQTGSGTAQTAQSVAPPAPAALPVAAAAFFVQAGAFSDPANAERLAAKLRGRGYGTVFVRGNRIAGRKLYRVRIGPVPDVAEFDRVVAALERAGVSDAQLAPD